MAFLYSRLTEKWILMMNKDYNLLVILGATAGGKTGLAVKVARHLAGEIISADSRQVYRGMDLGTGKDLFEYGEIPYHLIDIAEPGSEYNVFQFQQDCFSAIEGIWQGQKLPVICGGTGMYLDAILSGYRLVAVPPDPQLREELRSYTDDALRQKLLELKPEQHNTTNLEERERLVRAIEIALGEQKVAGELPPLPQISPLVFGIRWPREILRQRIAVRLRQRLEEGMIDEVRQLHESGVAWEQLEFYGLEYRLIAQYLQGKLNRNDMEQKLRSAIGQFAKRQETFFRRMEKRGVDIHWLDGTGDVFAEFCQILES